MTQATDNVARCTLCGEPMPKGEEMFQYHGYSGPCPKPPLPKPAAPLTGDAAALHAITRGVAPHRSLSPDERALWDEAQACLIGIAEAALKRT
jgi:hypothetical protein